MLGERVVVGKERLALDQYLHIDVVVGISLGGFRGILARLRFVVKKLSIEVIRGWCD